MRLRVAELLAARKWTPSDLHRRSGGRISLSTAYRLAANEVRAPSLAVLEALCEVFGIDDPGPLFDRDDRDETTTPDAPPARRRGGKRDA